MKRISIISLLIAILCVFALLCGCNKDVPNPPVEGLTSEQVETIRKAIFDKESKEYTDPNEKYNINFLYITKYIGTYNGHIVFEKRDGNYSYMAVVTEIEIDGIFICGNGNSEYNPMVYLKDGKGVLRLNKAYEEGYITKDDLYKIAEDYKNSYKTSEN